MPELEQNLRLWNADFDWSARGEEWSAWWGDTPALWYGALLPRIHPFVGGTVLEIAPGFGRWTHYLKDLAERLIIVDLAERCIDHCHARFATATNIDYHVNDGRSLGMVADTSVDFAFSFDSLVHADTDVMKAYARELARVLKPGGVAFLHHSNLGAHGRAVTIAKRFPQRALRGLVDRGVLIDLYAWRSEDVTAEAVASAAAESGLSCVTQELISWEHGIYLTDALSILTPRGSRWDRPTRRVHNPWFGREGRRMRALYASTSYAR